MTAAPTYKIEDLAHAGATLVQMGKMAEAQALLSKYNIKAVTDLKPEQYGAFAIELRLLGVQI
jgi:hypothetical protein